MGLTGAGRPRLEQRKRAGETARDEVLDAAAELFTTYGVAATSTRRIAEAVGVRQASLYHHFRTKNDILAALLSGTVLPPLGWARALAARGDAPEVLVHALVGLDGGQLWGSPWNLGLLYLLPEVRDPEFDPFHRQRAELRSVYGELATRLIARATTAPGGPVPEVCRDADLPFRLVETLPNLRADGLGAPDQPERTADLAVHVLGWRGDREALHARSRALAALVTDPAPAAGPAVTADPAVTSPDGMR